MLQEIVRYSLMSITHFLQQHLKRLGLVSLGASKTLGAPTTGKAMVRSLVSGSVQHTPMKLLLPAADGGLYVSLWA